MEVWNPLTTVATDQKRWSLTANGLRRSINQARWLTLVLAVSGAILETWAAQVHVDNPRPAQVLGYLGAVALGTLGVVRQSKLGSERVRAWILARAASEALKHEMYLFRSGTPHYAEAGSAAVLLSRREQILSKIQTVQRYRIDPSSPVKTPGPLDAEGYLHERIIGPNGQVRFFMTRSARYSRIQKRIELLELVLAIFGALLSAALTIAGRQGYGVWIAVVTTIGAAFAAHSVAQRYDQLTTSYRVTADRLAGIVDAWNASIDHSAGSLVTACEAALLSENQGWIAGADENQETRPDRNPAHSPEQSAAAPPPSREA